MKEIMKLVCKFTLDMELVKLKSQIKIRILKLNSLIKKNEYTKTTGND